MTDQQCEEVFQRLLEILRSHQLYGLINRVMEQIAEEKIIEDEVQTFKETPGSGPDLFSPLGPLHTPLKPVSKKAFSTIVPYTPQERLAILIDVIEQTLITPTAIAIYLQQDFLEKRGFQGMIFTSQDGKTAIKIDIHDQTLQSRKYIVEQLRRTLNQLRGIL
jgi:hypothetical protein